MAETPEQLPAAWATEAATQRELYANETAARVLEGCARRLAAALRASGDECLTLGEASHESGYSERRLRQMIAAGDVPQAGRKGVPRVRRRDLPRKPGKGQQDAPTGRVDDPRAFLARMQAKAS